MHKSIEYLTTAIKTDYMKNSTGKSGIELKKIMHKALNI